MERHLSMQDDFERVSEAVFAGGNLTFVVEEIDLFSSSHFIPPVLERIVSVGRHRGIGLWVTTRRPLSLHALIRSQAHQIISFRQTEPRDLAFMRDTIGAAALKLPKLGSFEYVRWKDELLTDHLDI